MPVERDQTGRFVFDGKQRLTITIAGSALVLAATIGLHSFVEAHVGRYFVASAQAQEVTELLSRQIKAAVDAANAAAQAAQQTASALSMHVSGQELKEARNKLDTLRTEISNTQLWESTNGANDLSRARRRDLENALERTRALIDCLEDGRANCQG